MNESEDPTQSLTPPPGWYQDPENPYSQRYWDGAHWTENRAAAAGVAAPPMTPKTSGLAIASLVCGLVWVYGVTSILAIIFSVIAKKNIRESNGWVTGGGMATAGLVLGIVGVVGAVVVWIVIIVGISEGETTYYYEY